MYQRKNTLNIKKNQSFTLNITSMTDMFTILLVFLLQSFASNQIDIQLPEKLNLPGSKSEQTPEEGFKITLFENNLKLDHKMWNLEKLKKEESIQNELIESLKQSLTQIEKMKKEKTALLIADNQTNTESIKETMVILGQAGFDKIKFLTTAK